MMIVRHCGEEVLQICFQLLGMIIFLLVEPPFAAVVAIPSFFFVVSLIGNVTNSPPFLVPVVPAAGVVTISPPPVVAMAGVVTTSPPSVVASVDEDEPMLTTKR